MKQSNYGEWVRSSSTPSRTERLKVHEEFEASELKKMLDNDWQAKKTKRPRIKKEPKESFKMWGTIKVNFEIPIEVLIKAGFRK